MEIRKKKKIVLIEKLTLSAFMYVVYIMILVSIPIGFISIINPLFSKEIAQGAQMWLTALPHDVWELFGAGYLGYAITKTWERIKNKH